VGEPPPDESARRCEDPNDRYDYHDYEERARRPPPQRLSGRMIWSRCIFFLHPPLLSVTYLSVSGLYAGGSTGTT